MCTLSFRPSLLARLAIGMILFVPSASPQTGTKAYKFTVHSVTGTGQGQTPQATFSVTDITDPSTPVPVDLVLDPAFTQTASGASRLFLQFGWSTVPDYTNENSGTTTGAALPVAKNVLSPAPLLIDAVNRIYQVTSPKPIPGTAQGSGTVIMEGHPAGQDATGAWTVRVPVRSAYQTFAITDAKPVARRQVVDINKCKVCHGTLTVHGNNRTDEPQVCVVCHNPNQTDITQRVFGDAPEVSIDFKHMVHAIHAGGRRKTAYQVMGFNHTLNDFSAVRFPARLSDCQKCHIGTSRGGTYEIPLKPGVLGSTVDTRSVLTATSKVINTNPADDLNMTPTAAVCSACHDDSETRQHMMRNGASFNTLQQYIDSGAVRERCVDCHGIGKDKSVRKVHLDD